MPRRGFEGGAAFSFNSARACACFTFLLLTLRMIVIAPVAMSDMHDFSYPTAPSLVSPHSNPTKHDRVHLLSVSLHHAHLAQTLKISIWS